jgi:hypothetical protein
MVVVVPVKGGAVFSFGEKKCLWRERVGVVVNLGRAGRCASGLRHKTFPKRLASDTAGGRRVDRRLKGAEWDGGPVQITITVGMRQTGALMLVSFAGMCRRKCALAPPAPSHVSPAYRQPLHNNNDNNTFIAKLNLADDQKVQQDAEGVTGDGFSCLASLITTHADSLGHAARHLRRRHFRS